MAGSLNSVTLIGNVGRDPEVRSFQNGGQVANLSVATSESWKSKETGERQEKTTWHNVAIFNENLIRLVEAYVKKGSKIGVTGSLQTRKWQDKDGNDRDTTEVVIQRFRGDLILLDKREDNGGGRREEPATEQGGSYADDLSDEIPFAAEWRG